MSNTISLASSIIFLVVGLFFIFLSILFIKRNLKDREAKPELILVGSYIMPMVLLTYFSMSFGHIEPITFYSNAILYGIMVYSGFIPMFRAIYRTFGRISPEYIYFRQGFIILSYTMMLTIILNLIIASQTKSTINYFISDNLVTIYIIASNIYAVNHLMKFKLFFVDVYFTSALFFALCFNSVGIISQWFKFIFNSFNTDAIFTISLTNTIVSSILIVLIAVILAILPKFNSTS